MKTRSFRYRAALLAAAMLAAHASPAAADWLPGRARIDSLLDALGGSDEIDASKTIDWGVLPGPFYTPETSLGLGIALVGLYRTDHGEQEMPLSSLTVSGFASITGTFGFNLDNYSYFNGDRQRLFVHGGIVNEPTRYWGIGYRAGRDDRAQGYTARSVDVWPQLYQRIAASLWAGLGWSLSQLQAAALEDGDANAIHATADGAAVFNSGLSIHLLHDTRDFAPNPARGHVFSVDYAQYRAAFGSDDAFDTLRTRYGIYHATSAKTTLAYEIYGDFRAGEVPWNLLSTLGGDARMRGYYDGRYRDRNTLSTQLEWRHQLQWRHGVVLWAGAGTLAPRPGELGKHWLPSVGTGYRFMFKPRINVRLDLGFGRDSAGFYFQVGEAY